VTNDIEHVSRSWKHPTDQWQSLSGEFVEVRLHGEVYRRGWVDAAMPDASGLWIAAEAVHPREYVDAASGYEVWTSLYPRTDSASSTHAAGNSLQHAKVTA
jgi:hypothetical protein